MDDRGRPGDVESMDDEEKFEVYCHFQSNTMQETLSVCTLSHSRNGRGVYVKSQKCFQS